MMHPEWAYEAVKHLNRLRGYLGLKEYQKTENGSLFVDIDETNRLEFQPGNWHSSTCEVTLHTWDVSYHNGDYFNHQTQMISSELAAEKIKTLRRDLEAQARIKIKRELDEAAVNEAMRAKGLLLDYWPVVPLSEVD